MTHQYVCEICNKLIIGKPIITKYMNGATLCYKCFDSYKQEVCHQEKEFMKLAKKDAKKINNDDIW